MGGSVQKNEKTVCYQFHSLQVKHNMGKIRGARRALAQSLIGLRARTKKAVFAMWRKVVCCVVLFMFILACAIHLALSCALVMILCFFCFFFLGLNCFVGYVALFYVVPVRALALVPCPRQSV